MKPVVLPDEHAMEAGYPCRIEGNPHGEWIARCRCGITVRGGTEGQVRQQLALTHGPNLPHFVRMIASPYRPRPQRRKRDGWVVG